MRFNCLSSVHDYEQYYSPYSGESPQPVVALELYL